MPDFPPRLMDHVLPSNATAYERTLASQVQHLLDLDIGLKDVWNPQTCPEHLLPYLAWALSVDIWNPNWEVSRKRAVIAQSLQLHALKGTREGIRRHLELLGARLVDVVAPPQEEAWGDVLNPAQREAWLSLYPQLRLYRHRDTTEVLEGESYYDDTMLFDDASDATYFGKDSAEELDGVRAFLFRNGTEVELPIRELIWKQDKYRRVGTIQVTMPGTQSDEFYFDGDLDAPFGDADLERNLIYSFNMRTNINQAVGEFLVTQVAPSLTAIDATYQDRFEPVPPRAYDAFFDDDTGIYDEDLIFGNDDAGIHVYHQLYLHDPKIKIPDLEGGFCFDGHLWGLPAYHAILKVDMSEPAEVGPMAFDLEAIEDGYWDDGKQTRLEDVLEAIRVSQSLRDVLIVDTTTHSPITLSDGFALDGAHRLGEFIKRF